MPNQTVSSQAVEGRKSILLLGGSRHQVPAIEAAKRLGYRTVLCDYLPDNPGQHVADVFYQESTTDRDLMLDIARRERVSGVLAFGTDVAAPTAAFICERLGLPGNPLKSVEILSEKHLFRPYLVEHGFNCPKATSLSASATPQDVLGAARAMEFPVVLKPTDSSGSRGVTVIDAPDEAAAADALDFAREFSRNGILELEEYIQYEFPHLIGGDIFVVDGKVEFWGLMSCLRDTGLAALVPVGKAFPSGLALAQEGALKSEVQRLVTELGIKFCEMNLEVIIGRGNKPYILELGARAGGNMIPLQLQDISGIDLVEAAVLCTMGEDPGDVSFDGGDKVMATSVLHASETGAFAGVEYGPEIAGHIYREMVYVRPGDHVERLNYGSKALGLVFLSFDTEEQMRGLMDRAPELIRVRVEAEDETEGEEEGDGRPDAPKKSILLLGGSQQQVVAIETAKRLGYRTVLCDYLPDNPGQFVADVFYQESTTDREKMLQIARREGVSGVLAYSSDPAAPTAAFVAERLGLPTNPLAAVETLSVKHRFREHLAANGFPCPKSVSVDASSAPSELIALAGGMRYPVVLKPSDSSGSKGISVIGSADERAFVDALALAGEFSRNKVLVLEEYIRSGFPRVIGGDVFVVDGEVRFWGLMSCLRDNAMGGLVPVGERNPSGLTAAQTDKVKEQVQALVTSLGIRFGELNVEVIVGEDDTPYFLELGARAGGNMIPVQLGDISGIDLIEANVRCAMGDTSLDVAFGGNDDAVATYVLHAREAGVFQGVEFAPELEEHVYRLVPYAEPGVRVDSFNNASKAIGIAFMRFDDVAQMEGLLGRADQLITVKVSDK